MSLPQYNKEQSYITIKTPSGKSIGVCGWKVKEEKELLFALEVEENVEENKIIHIINLLKQCVNDKSKFDSLSESDLIKIAIEVRKLAKGDTIEYNYECPHCANKFFDEVNLTKEQVVKFFDETPLKVNDRLTMTFKDLNWKKVETLYKAADSHAKFSYKHLMNSIDSITLDGESFTEFTPENAETLIDELDSDDLKAIEDGFAARLSSCSIERKIKCIKCKEMIDINFGDLLSFLVL